MIRRRLATSAAPEPACCGADGRRLPPSLRLVAQHREASRLRLRSLDERNARLIHRARVARSRTCPTGDIFGERHTCRSSKGQA
jgi:hypothetical protein